jgi:nitrogen fixation protein FixH
MIERDSLRWPVALGLTLAVGMAASLAFLGAATRQPPDVLPVNTWTAGAEWNESLRAQARARARGWRIELRAERRPDGVHVELSPSSSREPLPKSLDVRLRRERPERGDFDAEVALEARSGRWTAEIPLPLAGRWLLVARAGDGDAWVEREFALDVPP